jgi:hypothetical protein
VLPEQKKIDMETTARSETPAGAGKSSLNPDALNQLLGQMVNDLGAAVNGALVVLGDGLGIYRALAGMAWHPRKNSPKRPTSMSDSFANGLVPRRSLNLNSVDLICIRLPSKQRIATPRSYKL